eukprot:11581180-Heterocapsa_arctica.AAC.1
MPACRACPRTFGARRPFATFMVSFAATAPRLSPRTLCESAGLRRGGGGNAPPSTPTAAAQTAARSSAPRR